MIMGNKLRYVHVMARSNFDTRIQLTISGNLDDSRELIVSALTKISQFSSFSEEKFYIEHIDSLSRLHDILHDMDK